MTFILGLLKSARFWVIAVAVTAVAGTIVAFSQARYEAGYNAAELKWRTAQQKAIDDAIEVERRNWEIAADAAETNIENEVQIDDKVRIIERDVPRIVERVVRPDCRDLGPDIQRLFNDAIRAGNNLSGPSTGPAAEPDAEMPTP